MKCNKRQVLSKARSLADHFSVNIKEIETHIERDMTTALYPDEFAIYLLGGRVIDIECVTQRAAIENELCNINGDKRKLRKYISKNHIGIYTRTLDGKYYWRHL